MQWSRLPEATKLTSTVFGGLQCLRFSSSLRSKMILVCVVYLYLYPFSAIPPPSLSFSPFVYIYYTHLWEIDLILDKRKRKYGRGKPRTEYLVRWKGLRPAYDQWYPAFALNDAQDMVDEYENSL